MENILGIEICDDRIKVLEIVTVEEGRQPFPIRLDTIECPPDIVHEGIIIEPKLLSDKISAFVKENKIYTKKAIALISPAYIFTRIIRLPQTLSDSQIRLNLEAEINQYPTFRGKADIIDFKKIEEISEEGIKKINVLFGTTSKALTESYLKALELAGLDLVEIDVPILSIVRLLDEVDFKSSSLDVILLIVIGQKNLQMCILKGNRPRFLHSIETDMSVFDRDRNDFIERFVSAIRLVVSFYQERIIHGEQISRIVIHPLDSKHSLIPTLIQEKLPQIPVQISNPLPKIYIETEKTPFLEQLRFDFSCLLGATLKIENKNQPFNLNLLSEQKRMRRNRLNQIYFLFIALTLSFSVMIISLGWVLLRINILQRKINYLKMQLQQPSAELNKAVGIKGRRENLNKQIMEVSFIKDSTKKLLYFKNIGWAAVLVPDDLWLMDMVLEESNGYLVINGEAKTEKPIFSYIASLTDSNNFSTVELVSSKGQADIIKFTLKCKIK